MRLGVRQKKPARVGLAGERAAGAARGDNWPAKAPGTGPSDYAHRVRWAARFSSRP